VKNNEHNQWFPDARNDEKIKIRLFCLPFAGGNSFFYRTWKDKLPEWINVCPVHLPGRAKRINESGFTDLNALTEVIFQEIQGFLNYPFAIFGYSMGAIIGFELTRLLQKQGITPRHLFVAASPPPPLTDRSPIVYNLPVKEFKEELLKLDGTPKEVLENQELFDLMLPLLRADFELIETYRFKEGQILSCPIFAFGGDEDAEVSEKKLKQWQLQTTDLFNMKTFAGGHFFINSATNEVLNQIIDTLS
jgi:medium-chain acyl-[acyl-carrier-protein] hydrolase